MSFSSFSEKPREIVPVVPVMPISRRRFFTALAGGGGLALLGGLTMKNAWPRLFSELTAQPLGIQDSIFMAWSRNLTHVAVTSYPDTSVTTLWDYERQRIIGTLHPFGHEQISTSRLAWSPDGEQLLQVAGGPGPDQNTYVICWDVQTQQKRYVTTTRTTALDPWKVFWSPDGQRVAVIGSSTFVLLDARNGQELLGHQFEDEDTTALTWSPAGDRLALLLGNKSSKEIVVQIWNAQTSQPIARLTQAHILYDSFDSSGTLAWLPGEDYLAVAAHEKLWLASLNGGANIPLASFNETFNSYLLAISPNGNFLTVASSNGLALWNIGERRLEPGFFRGYGSSFIWAMSWINASQLAIIDGSRNRLILER